MRISFHRTSLCLLSICSRDSSKVFLSIKKTMHLMYPTAQCNSRHHAYGMILPVHHPSTSTVLFRRHRAHKLTEQRPRKPVATAIEKSTKSREVQRTHDCVKSIRKRKQSHRSSARPVAVSIVRRPAFSFRSVYLSCF